MTVRRCRCDGLLVLNCSNGSLHENLIAFLSRQLKRSDWTHKMCRFITGRVNCLRLAIENRISSYLIHISNNIFHILIGRDEFQKLILKSTWWSAWCNDSMLTCILGVTHENHTPVNHFILWYRFHLHDCSFVWINTSYTTKKGISICLWWTSMKV